MILFNYQIIWKKLFVRKWIVHSKLELKKVKKELYYLEKWNREKDF